jgi:hypothetical protein
MKGIEKYKIEECFYKDVDDNFILKKQYRVMEFKRRSIFGISFGNGYWRRATERIFSRGHDYKLYVYRDTLDEAREWCENMLEKIPEPKTIQIYKINE